MRLAFLAILLAAPPALAQTAPGRFSGSYTLTAGVASNGPTGRIAGSSMLTLGRGVSLGVASRITAASGAYAPDQRPAAGSSDMFVEVGPSARLAWAPAPRVELAGSVGYAVAVVTSADEPSFTGIADVGFTVPVEAEAALRLGRRVGVVATASRSLATRSYRNDPDTTVEPYGDGYALKQWTATVGLRLGR